MKQHGNQILNSGKTGCNFVISVYWRGRFRFGRINQRGEPADYCAANFFNRFEILPAINHNEFLMGEAMAQ